MILNAREPSMFFHNNTDNIETQILDYKTMIKCDL